MTRYSLPYRWSKANKKAMPQRRRDPKYQIDQGKQNKEAMQKNDKIINIIQKM